MPLPTREQLKAEADYVVQFSADNLAVLDEISMIIYGASGIGKTTIARTMPDPLFLSMRGGGEHRPIPLIGTDIPYVEFSVKSQIDKFLLDMAATGTPKLTRPATASTLPEAIAVIQQNPDGLIKYQPKTIVVDQVTSLYNIYMEHCLTKVTRNRENVDTPNQQDYQQARRLIMNFFFEISKLTNVHKVYLCLEDIDEDQITKIRQGLPEVPGKLSREIARYVDFVFRMHLRREMRPDAANPTNVRATRVHEFRALLTQPEDVWQAKDSSGKLPKIIETPGPDFRLWDYLVEKLK